jgi:hypothetical protein
MHYVIDQKIDSYETKMNKTRIISNKIKNYFTENYHIYKIVLQPEFTDEDVLTGSEKCYLEINVNNNNDNHNHDKSKCQHHHH